MQRTEDMGTSTQHWNGLKGESLHRVPSVFVFVLITVMVGGWTVYTLAHRQAWVWPHLRFGKHAPTQECTNRDSAILLTRILNHNPIEHLKVDMKNAVSDVNTMNCWGIGECCSIILGCNTCSELQEDGQLTAEKQFSETVVWILVWLFMFCAKHLCTAAAVVRAQDK